MFIVCLLSREGGTSLLGSGSSDATRQEFAQGKVIIFVLVLAGVLLFTITVTPVAYPRLVLNHDIS